MLGTFASIVLIVLLIGAVDVSAGGLWVQLAIVAIGALATIAAAPDYSGLRAATPDIPEAS